MVKTKILLPLPENIDQAADALRLGEVVAIPTETVYGLAGNVWNENALTKIFETKGRPTYDPLIVHVQTTDPGESILTALEQQELVDLSGITSDQKQRIENVLCKFWPGPLTVILPKHARVPNLVTSSLPTIAIRMPKHPVAQAILRASQLPLAAPSANRFGRISPTKASHVFEELEGRIPLIIDGGSCEIGLESTIVALLGNSVTVLRPGAISAEDVAKITGTKTSTVDETVETKVLNSPQTAPQAPGMLEGHYAPRKPLRIFTPETCTQLVQEILATNKSRDVKLGLLVMSGNATDKAQQLQSFLRRALETKQIHVLARELSSTTNFEAMAKNFFSVLRELDHSPAEFLLAEPVPVPQTKKDEALARALTDRLKRASKGSHFTT